MRAGISSQKIQDCPGEPILAGLDYLIDRREFLRGAASAAAITGLCTSAAFGLRTDDINQNVSRILSRIHPPRFPNTTFNIEQYGAHGDGTSDSGPAIVKAIAYNVRINGKLLSSTGV